MSYEPDEFLEMQYEDRYGDPDLEAEELESRYGVKNCGLCGESIHDWDEDIAEMYDPEAPQPTPNMIGHYGCGLEKGMVIA